MPRERLERRAQTILRLLAEYGRAKEDPLYARLPEELLMAKTRLREKYSAIMKQDPLAPIEKFIIEYESVAGSEALCRYLVIVAALCVSSPKGSPRFTSLYDALREVYEGYGMRDALERDALPFSKAHELASALSEAYRKLSGRELHLEPVDIARGWSRAIREIAKIARNEGSLLRRLARAGGIRELSELCWRLLVGLKDFRASRSMRMFARWVAHPTITAPIAVEVCRLERYRGYLAIGDPYSLTVFLRAGLFRYVDSPKTKLLWVKATKHGRLTVKAERVDDLLQRFINMSRDPIAVENALFWIGVEHCREERCEQCPLAEECKRLPIRVK